MATRDQNKSQWGTGGGNGYQPVYHPGPTPQYAPPSEPYPPSQDTAYGDQKSPYEGDRFKPKKRMNDIFFTIFFVLQFAGFVVLSALVISEWVKQGGLGGGLGGNTGTAVTLDSWVILPMRGGHEHQRSYGLLSAIPYTFFCLLLPLVWSFPRFI